MEGEQTALQPQTEIPVALQEATLIRLREVTALATQDRILLIALLEVIPLVAQGQIRIHLQEATPVAQLPPPQLELTRVQVLAEALAAEDLAEAALVVDDHQVAAEEDKK